jgi:glycosyltransferase involved in cell wall biosynthesis
MQRKIGVAIGEPWPSFNDIYADFAEHYQTRFFQRRVFPLPVFNARINRYLFHHDLQSFMQANEVVFFEWASELLVVASHLPKSCAIVTRLHRFELYQWADQVNWDAVDKVILVSQAKKEEFAQRFPEHARKTVVVYSAVDLNKFQPHPRPFHGNIGILGSLIPRKRVYELILTFYELLQLRNDLHLHIGGELNIRNSDYYLALIELVKNLNLQDQVTFYGQVKDPHNWLKNIDVFLSNSYSEGLQATPIEAMASGCYCLSHHWVGADELLPPEYLYYTDSQLKEKLLNYFDLPEATKDQHRARMRVIACEKFDVNLIKSQIRSVIEGVVAKDEPGK